MLRKIQMEQCEWATRNFGKINFVDNMLGVVEEVGELSHSVLKEKQGIRVDENHAEKAKDAMGDIIIYIAGMCNARGWDLEDIVENVWSSVSKRNWKKHPKKGIPFE